MRLTKNQNATTARIVKTTPMTNPIAIDFPSIELPSSFFNAEISGSRKINKCLFSLALSSNDPVMRMSHSIVLKTPLVHNSLPTSVRLSHFEGNLFAIITGAFACVSPHSDEIFLTSGQST